MLGEGREGGDRKRKRNAVAAAAAAAVVGVCPAWSRLASSPCRPTRPPNLFKYLVAIKKAALEPREGEKECLLPPW